MIMFGGCDHDNEKLNDLWVFNFESGSWNEIKTDQVNVAIPRSGHSVAMYGDLMLIFGGIYEVTKELNDLMAFDFSTNHWITLFEELGPASNSPTRTANKSLGLDNSPTINKMNSL